MDTSIGPLEFDSAAEALLNSCHLPISDLSASSEVLLFGHAPAGLLSGMVGLEIYGADALLRSLAVTESNRSAGLGAALVASAERHAAARGVNAVYLLTTTADMFFERRGYTRVSRAEAPAAIASTSQFSALCPSSSAFMVKRFGGQEFKPGRLREAT